MYFVDETWKEKADESLIEPTSIEPAEESLNPAESSTLRITRTLTFHEI